MCFFFQAEDGIRDTSVTGVQTCALPISGSESISGGKKLGVGVSDKHGTAAHEPSRDRCLQRVIGTAAAALTVQVQSQIGRASCREREDDTDPYTEVRHIAYDRQ